MSKSSNYSEENFKFYFKSIKNQRYDMVKNCFDRRSNFYNKYNSNIVSYKNGLSKIYSTKPKRLEIFGGFSFENPLIYVIENSKKIKTKNISLIISPETILDMSSINLINSHIEGRVNSDSLIFKETILNPNHFKFMVGVFQTITFDKCEADDLQKDFSLDYNISNNIVNDEIKCDQMKYTDILEIRRLFSKVEKFTISNCLINYRDIKEIIPKWNFHFYNVTICMDEKDFRNLIGLSDYSNFIPIEKEMISNFFEQFLGVQENCSIDFNCHIEDDESLCDDFEIS